MTFSKPRRPMRALCRALARLPGALVAYRWGSLGVAKIHGQLGFSEESNLSPVISDQKNLLLQMMLDILFIGIQ
ncbi:hypothetical protein [Achromobacter spanius]|uniref:hypothetical protein n=1 Tax=Achromobacter spanius TaxID=217203 RepID=UPI0011B0AEC2|nr:hypothetical protein [Achromobacter spanius]